VAASLNARPAELGDAAAIAEIYNQAIEDRTATFETEPRTADVVGELLGTRTGRYPAVVVEDGNRVLGFAWTSEYRPRSAYAGVAEFAIYVARTARGQGVGRLALTALMTEAELRGFWKLVASSRKTSQAAGYVPRGGFGRSASIAGTGNWMEDGWIA
jgi:L-amino acid N-acyltransferase YncA